MNIKIRNERISDYNSISNVNYEAFLGWHPDNPYVSEPVLVDLLRHNSMYDPELSLVAELDGEVIGHALFSPFKFIVLGTEQLGVILGPIAVKPEFQRKGVGEMLMEEGHRKAKEKGFTFSLLCGHTSYYPKFGYKTKMFSVSGVNVSLNIGSFNGEGFAERPVNSGDIPWVMEAWKSLHGSDALTLFPGGTIGEWSNLGPGCRCSVLLKNERILGYARYGITNPLSVKQLVAKSEDMPDMLAYLAWKNYGKAEGEIGIALAEEKLKEAVGDSAYFKVFDQLQTGEAFMIKVLDGESSIASYCEQVGKAGIRPGIISFPPMFDLEDGRCD